MPSTLLAAFCLLIGGEQLACSRTRVHAAPPGLRPLLRWGKVKRFRKIVRITLLLALSYTLIHSPLLLRENQSQQ